MDLGPTSDADLLQRALEGEQVSEPGILELVAVVHAVTAVDQAGLAPRREFVADLRARLLEDDGGLAAAPVPLDPDAPSDTGVTTPLTPTSGPVDDDHEVAGDAPSDGDRGPGATVSVLRVAARPLRYVAAAAAALLVIGGALGWASRSALPGDALYGVKQVLDRAAVQLSGSRFDQGLTYLAQAEQHIGETRDLLDRGAPAAGDVETALDLASDATTRAQTFLLEAYRVEGRADALTELADFYARALPQVDALKARVPASALPAWQRLHDLLAQNRVAVLRELASCTACGDRAGQARQLLSQVVTGTPPASAIPTTPPRATRPPGSSAPAPTGTARPPTGTATAPGGGGAPLPGIGITGGVTLPGSTVQLPGVGVSSSSIGVGGGGVTLPGGTVGLPSVGVTGGTVGAGGGGVTLPGVTVPLPSLTVTLPTLPKLPLPTLLP